MNRTDKPHQRRTVFPQRKLLPLAICSTLALIASSPVYAAEFDIAEHPLVLGKTPEPNVVYIHDDSGSMAWEYMPDNNYGSGNRSRGRLYNALAYDPNYTYRLPVDHNGTEIAMPAGEKVWTGTYGGFASSRSSTTLASSEYWYGEFDETNTYSGSTKCNIANLQAKIDGDMDFTTVDNQKIASNDCYDKITISNAAQKENFRIWWSFYRTRVMASKSGVSLAFSEIDGGIRLGYMTINKRQNLDTTSASIYQGVKLFSDKDGLNGRKRFYDWLLSQSSVPASGGTPLPPALKYAGDYYLNNIKKYGPWSTTPGENKADANILSCRRSYAILMSDGFWNNGVTGIGDPDGDGVANTLADVAMQYYNQDLLPSIDNNVRPTSKDPHTFQHMNTFTIGLGVKGTVKEADAWEGNVVWHDPATSDNYKIDDMLHAAVNSKGGFYSAKNPEGFAKAIKDILGAIVNDAASVAPMAFSSSMLSEDNYSFLANFDSENWTGDVVAAKYTIPRDADGNATGVGTFSNEIWRAAKKIPAPASRNIVTWKDGSNQAVKFNWDNLTTDQQQKLMLTAPGSATSAQKTQHGKDVLAWLRGSDEKEQQKDTDEGFRNRGKTTDRNVLGDIVNSGVVYVAKQNYGYGAQAGFSASERSSYADRANNGVPTTRAPMVYVGANDGMLHGFDVATGTEKFAYIPNAVYDNLATLADPEYKHKYFVDGLLRVSDAYISGTWKSVLVGSTGAGGKSYFAIDVNNPSSLDENSVMWEFTHDELGTAIGQAAIGKTESGQWVAIFGNGYNSKSRTAQLFVVDLATGTLIKTIDTGIGTENDPNGLASPVAVDIDRNGLIDMVYAGDYQGNLWKFDFTGNASANWKVAFGSTPLFKAEYPSGGTVSERHQAITAAPAVRFHMSGGLMVYFGTGKFFLKDDQDDKSVQSLYGVRDECGISVVSNCGSGSAGGKVKRTDLQQQKIEYEIENLTVDNAFGNQSTYKLRSVSANAYDVDKKGFYMDLISPVKNQQGERVTVTPNLSFNDRVIFSTTIPDDDPCGSGISSWMMALNPFSGANPNTPVFDLNNDVQFDDTDMAGGRVPGGVGSDGAGQGSVMHGTDQAIGCVRDNCFSMLPDPTTSGRQSWQQLL